MKMKVFVIRVRGAFLGGLWLFLALLNDVNGDLPVGEKTCGDHRCSANSFCNPFDNHCHPCSNTCEPSSNNYQPQTCKEQCQGYIHDQLYVKKDAEITLLGKKMQQLITLTSVTLVVSCVLFVVFVGYVLGRNLRKKSFFKNFKKGKEGKMGDSNKFDVEASKIGYKGEGLKLDMPIAHAQVPDAPHSTSPSQDPVTPATTSTPLSRPRHPSEDTTLEYAYDNPALAPSPVLDKDMQQEGLPRKESSF